MSLKIWELKLCHSNLGHTRRHSIFYFDCAAVKETKELETGFIKGKETIKTLQKETKLLEKLATLQHKDDKKLSAMVSYKRSLYNKKLIQSGIRDKNALYPLYQFSK